MKRTATRSLPDLFRVETSGGVTWLRFQQRELAGIDIRRMQPLWSFLDQQVEHPSNVVILEVHAGLLSSGSIDALLDGRAKLESRGCEESSQRDQELWQAFEDLRREENSQIQVIERITTLDSLVIAVVQGEIDMALLGPVLSCDYRIASDDTLIVNRILDGGLPSIGGTMWFLVKRLGDGVAHRLLWSGKNLSSSEALEMGLLSEVVPTSDIESRTREVAQRFATKPRNRLRAVKNLLNATSQDLQSYLEHERNATNRTLGSIVGTRWIKADHLSTKGGFDEDPENRLPH